MSGHLNALSYMPHGVREAFMSMNRRAFYAVDEIRLRRGRALSVLSGDRNLFVSASGDFCRFEGALTVTDAMMNECIKNMTSASRYALDDAIAEGYIPLSCGMRAGVCGRVLTRGGKAVTLSSIDGIALRITRRVDSFATPLYTLFKSGGVKSTLVIAPPACGKTTFLRSLIALSCLEYRVAVCDSRGELLCGGIERMPIDAMTHCPKDYAIETLTRVMDPQLIICDELGFGEESALMQNASCGVPIVASVHAANIDEAMERPFVRRICEAGVFRLYAVLSKRGAEFDCRIGEISCV